MRIYFEWKKQLLLTFLLVFEVFFVVTRACAADDKIAIGSILLLSGEGASWGIAARNGIEMATEEVNSRGGVLGKKLVVNFQDDQGDPRKSISAFNHLVDVAGVRSLSVLRGVNLASRLLKWPTVKRL